VTPSQFLRSPPQDRKPQWPAFLDLMAVAASNLSGSSFFIPFLLHQVFRPHLDASQRKSLFFFSFVHLGEDPPPPPGSSLRSSNMSPHPTSPFRPSSPPRIEPERSFQIRLRRLGISVSPVRPFLLLQFLEIDLFLSCFLARTLDFSIGLK